MRFDISFGWKQYKLKQLSKIYDGTHQTPKYKNEGIKFVSVEDINDLYATSKYITNEAFVRGFKVVPKQNDILMTRIGDIGTTAIVTKNEPLAYYVSLALIKPLDNLDSLFTKYMIESTSFQHELWKRTIHVAFPKKINKDEIGECLCFVPELSAQRKIGTFLSKIDERIDTQNKIIEKLESLKKQINNDFFSSLKNKVLFKTIYITAGEGGTPDTKNVSYYNNGNIPFIKIDDLYSKFIVEAKSFINENGLKHSSAWVVPSNSVLLSNGATIGESAINLIPVTTKQGILGIVPASNFNNEFLYYLFKTNVFKRQLRRITTKGTMDAAYLKDINTLIVPSCAIELQNKYVDKIRKIEEKIDNEKRLRVLYTIQKKFMLDNLFI